MEDGQAMELIPGVRSQRRDALGWFPSSSSPVSVILDVLSGTLKAFSILKRIDLIDPRAFRTVFDAFFFLRGSESDTRPRWRIGARRILH
ncbi:MAG: hypothetical protein V4568_13685 [Pseudomonadota bacterium]